jgi:hypothetical protein
MIYRGPSFLAVVCMIRLHARPLLSRQQIVSLSQPSCVSAVQLTNGRVGRVWSRIIRLLESLGSMSPILNEILNIKQLCDSTDTDSPDRANWFYLGHSSSPVLHFPLVDEI